SGTESRPTQSSSNVVVFPPTTLFDTTNSSPSIADDPPAGDFSSRRKAPNRDTPVELRMMLNARLSVHTTRLMNVALTANILWVLEAEPAKTMFWKLVIRFRRMNTRRIVSLPPPAPTQSTQAKPDVVVWLTPSNLQSSTRTSPIPEKLTVTGDPTPAGVKTQRWMATVVPKEAQAVEPNALPACVKATSLTMSVTLGPAPAAVTIENDVIRPPEITTGPAPLCAVATTAGVLPGGAYVLLSSVT